MWLLFPSLNGKSKSLRRCLPGDALPEVAHGKVAPCYVEGFRDAGVSREFADAMWTRNKADGNDLKEILSLAE